MAKHKEEVFKIPVEFFLGSRKYNKILDDPEVIKKCILCQYNKTITTELKVSENSWLKNVKNENENVKRIKGILNKLNETNYEKLVSEIRPLSDNCEKEIVDLLVTKSMLEPGYVEYYVRMCKDLNLNDKVNDIIMNKFQTKKHINLVKFIYLLYSYDIIKDINVYILNTFKEIQMSKDIDINLNILIAFYKELNDVEFLKNYFIKIEEILESDGSLKISPRVKFLFKDVVRSFRS